MWKLLLVLGILLDVLSVVFMCGILALPMIADDNENAQNILQSLLCKDGETYSQESYTVTDSRGTSTNTNMYCQAPGGEIRNMTGRMILITAIGFTIPFIVGLFLIIGSSTALVRGRVSATMRQSQTFVRSTSSPDFQQTGKNSWEAGGIQINYDPTTGQTSLDGITPKTDTASELTLSAKLQQIEDAQARGLISPDEYNAARRRILDEDL